MLASIVTKKKIVVKNEKVEQRINEIVNEIDNELNNHVVIMEISDDKVYNTLRQILFGDTRARVGGISCSVDSQPSLLDTSTNTTVFFWQGIPFCSIYSMPMFNRLRPIFDGLKNIFNIK